jgi:hypothetical protein
MWQKILGMLTLAGVIVLIVVFSLATFVTWEYGPSMLNKLEYETDIPDYISTSSTVDDYHLSEFHIDTKTTVYIWYNYSGPMFKEDEWINGRLWVQCRATFPDGNQYVDQLYPNVYIIDNQGNPARGEINYGIHEATQINITDGSQSIIEVNYTQELVNGYVDWIWFSDSYTITNEQFWYRVATFQIKFENPGNYGLKVDTLFPSEGRSYGWLNNTINVQSNLDYLQLQSLYEQKTTNERTMGLAYTGLIVSIWSVLIALISVVFNDSSIAHIKALRRIKKPKTEDATDVDVMESSSSDNGGKEDTKSLDEIDNKITSQPPPDTPTG